MGDHVLPKGVVGVLRILDKLNPKKAAGAYEQRVRALAFRQIIVCVVVFVVLALPAVFVTHPIAYIPLLTYLLLLATSWMYLCTVKKGLLVRSDFEEESCTRTESVKLPLAVCNRSPLPVFKALPQVFVANPYGDVEQSEEAVIAIDNNEDARISASVACAHIGSYQIGLKGILLFDPFGLLHVEVACVDHASIVATPLPCEASALEFSQLAMRKSLMPVRSVISDDVDYAGVRDYEFGDPMKSVHWKLSARTENLQTRLFETNVNTKTAVIIDFHALALSHELLMEARDVLVESAITSFKLSQSRKLETELCFTGKTGRMIKYEELPDSASIGELVGELPLLSDAVSEQDAVGLLLSECGISSGVDNAVLCTSTLTPKLVAAILSLCARNIAVTVILVSPHSERMRFIKESRNLMADLDAAGAVCLLVSDVADMVGGGTHE